MKNYPFKKTCSLLLLFFVASWANAQNTKPSVFQNYPNEIALPATVLDGLFTQAQNTPVNINLANFTIQGTLTNVIEKTANVKSLIIKVSNFNNIVFSVSRISDVYTPEKYMGRLMNAQQYADYYELQLENGAYKLKKQQTDQVLLPCRQ